MSDLSRLSPRDEERLAAIERQLRAESPALDHALAHGAFRGLPDPSRTLRGRSGWPVAVLVVLGGLLVAVGMGSQSVVPLIVGTYVLALSSLALWLPCRRRS